jgi:SAM-dependent methyltransferase
MASVAQHYEQLLAPVYLWMCGGAPAALQAGRAEVEALGLPVVPGSAVVDLGAGFGMHAIAFARAGARVTAIESSSAMLRALDELRGDLPVHPVHGDLRSFRRHLAGAPDLIVCLGDTITHLPGLRAVEQLIEDVHAALRAGGVFVISLRDYSEPLAGDRRFIPVRSDANRLLTCFLEYRPRSVLVHDLLQERTAEGWTTRVSHYRKLRLAPAHLGSRLESAGFLVRCEAGPAGMVRLVARRL